MVKQNTKDNNMNEQHETPASPSNAPKEQQHFDEPTETVHMEENPCDTATLSSTSLKTEDIAALDKLFN